MTTLVLLAVLAQQPPVAASPVAAPPVAAPPVAASPVAASPVNASPVAASPVAVSPVAASPVAASVAASPVAASQVAAPPVAAPPVAAPLAASPGAEPVEPVAEAVDPLSRAAPPQINDAPLSDRGGRVRFGASVQGGWRTLMSSFVIDLDVRVGMQVTQWWSVFGLVKINLATNSGFTSSASGAPLVGVIGVMIEAMLNNHIYFAVGPLLGYGTFSGAELEGRAIPRFVVEQNGASFKPGFDVRLGFATARSKPPRFSRNGVSIGLELVGLYHSQLSEMTFSRTPSTPIAPWWVFTPMVSIGIDTR